LSLDLLGTARACLPPSEFHSWLTRCDLMTVCLLELLVASNRNWLSLIQAEKERLSGQLTHLEGGRGNLGVCETRINGPNQAGQALMLGTDTLSCLLPLSMMAPWVLPPESWETEPNNLHFLPLLWITGFQF